MLHRIARKISGPVGEVAVYDDLLDLRGDGESTVVSVYWGSYSGDMPRSSTPEEPLTPCPIVVSAIVLSRVCSLSASSASSSLTGLNRFNPKACGLPPPCLRLTRLVAETRSRLGMEWAGSTLFQSHLQRPVVQHFVAHAYTLVTDLSIL